MTKPQTNDVKPPSPSDAWYRQPILWLGVFIFAISMAGCVWMIVLAIQHPDVATHTPDRTVLGVPVERPAPSTTTSP